MSFTGSNLCNAAATVLPVCTTCTGEGVTYCFVKKECPLCEGKKSVCAECEAAAMFVKWILNDAKTAKDADECLI
jgi:DnaJ-class molecular chaperone